MKASAILFCSLLLFTVNVSAEVTAQTDYELRAPEILSPNTPQSGSEHQAVLVPEAQSAPYYEDYKRGWFWYEKTPEKPKKRAARIEPEKKGHRLPSLKDHTLEQLWDMHPDDFQALLMDFRKKAVWRPTPEHVQEYYYIQDIARRKALAFTNVAGYVMQTNPELSLSKDYPTAMPGQNALVRSRRGEVKETIARAQGNYGLLYFYSPLCEYCSEQEKIIRWFEQQYGWEIKRIDFTQNKHLAEMFGVTIVPSILLVYRNSKDAIPVSAGVVSVDEMEDKIYRGVRLLAGDITPQEYGIYDFQKGGGFDVTAPAMKGRQGGVR